MPNPLLADAELVLRTFLVSSAGAGVTALTGATDDGNPRVYTITPTPAPDAGIAFVRLFRIGGAPDANVSVDRPVIQLECYGGSKFTAGRLLEEVRRAIAGIADATHAGASVGRPIFGTARYLPDPDFKPARPRYIADVAFVLRPARS